MIRSEHTGTGPLSSQLLQKAHQALKNDGKVTAKELHELRQELGPNPTQDELTFIANLDNPDVIAAVSLLEKGEPVENVVQVALAKMDRSDNSLSAEAGKNFKIDANWAQLPHIQKAVSAIQEKSPEEVDQLLVIMEKVRVHKPLSPEEEKRLSAAVPDRKLLSEVQVHLLRNEMTHELQRLHLKNPTLANACVDELVKTLTASQERPSMSQLQAVFEKVPALARRPALLSEAIVSELRTVAWGYQAWSEQQAQAPRDTAIASKGAAQNSPQAVLVNDRNQFYDQMLKMNDNELRRLNFEEDGDIAGLTGLIHNQGADLAELFQEQVRLGVLEGRGPGSNAVLIDGNSQRRVAPNVDFKSKMGYVVVQALLNYKKPEMAQLSGILDKLNPKGASLSAQENELLRSLGLRFQDGKLYNLANKQEVTTQELGQLKQTAQMIQRVNNPTAAGITPTQLQALTETLEVIAKSQILLNEVEAFEAEIMHNDAEIQKLRVQFDQTLTDLGVAQGQQQETAAQARVAAEKQQMLNGLIQQVQSGNLGFLQQFSSPEKLAELNKILAEHGLSLELNSGSPVFKRNGQALGPENLGDYLQAALQGQTAKLQELDKKLAAAVAAVAQLQTRADQEAATLDSRVREQTEMVSVFKEKIDDLKKTNGQLDEKLQNPILADILPRELLTDYLQARIDGALERVPALLEQVDNNLSQSKNSLIRGHLMAEFSQFLLQQAQDLQAQFGDLFKVSDQLNEALKSQLDAELQALVAKANEAQALLSQTAKPDPQSLEKATQAWLEEVLKTTEQLNTLLSEQQTSRQTERQQVAQQVEKIRRNAEYHLRQLAGFDTRRKESVDEILRKSIQNFQADRPFLARSIQKI
ncbi:MAG: hypothetical protein IV090_22875 [Candidatus Sericytochromatia bacterium]|nr:hypothetical protein [Candidatus Sericytochromatia bacterium]